MDYDWRGWLKTQKVYASRGYVSLVGWLVTLGTFSFVVYDDLVEVFPFLLGIFPNAFIFVLVVFPIGLGILTRLGKWDWKKGTFPKEGETAFLNNPEWIRMMIILRAICEKVGIDFDSLFE